MYTLNNCYMAERWNKNIIIITILCISEIMSSNIIQGHTQWYDQYNEPNALYRMNANANIIVWHQMRWFTIQLLVKAKYLENDNGSNLQWRDARRSYSSPYPLPWSSQYATYPLLIANMDQLNKCIIGVWWWNCNQKSQK